MAALTFKVGGDTSGLKKALGGIDGMLNNLGGAVTNFARRGAVAATALGAAGLAKAALDLKKALDLGGRLSDVAANTGLLAGQALVLERALQDAGISGEKLQPTINKMQKSIVEAGDGMMTYKRAFDELGLSIDDLRQMDPATQFFTLAQALSGLEDPAERSARAMQIFGRAGGKLGALFANPQALENAATSVGAQADILNESAEAFDRSADLLGGMGKKLQGFFVGMADFINPILLPVLEELNKLDFAKQGEKFGKVVAIVAEGFSQGKLGRILMESLVFAGKGLVNLVFKGFAIAGTVLLGSLKSIWVFLKEMFATFFSGDYWKSIGVAAKTGLKMAFGMETDAKDVVAMDKAMENLDVFGKANEAREASLQDSLKELDEVMAMKGILDNQENSQTVKNLIEGLNESVEARKEAAEEDVEKKKRDKVDFTVPKMEEEDVEKKKRDKVDFTEPTMEEEQERGRMIQPIVSSLGAIGGGTIRGTRASQMDVERNRLLKDIARNTASPQAAVYA